MRMILSACVSMILPACLRAYVFMGDLEFMSVHLRACLRA